MKVIDNKIMQLEDLLVSNDNALLIELRFGKGLDNKKVEEISIVLEDLAKEYKQSDCLPKRLVSLFVDFPLAMEGSLSLYNDTEQEKIYDAIDKIMDLIRECVN